MVQIYFFVILLTWTRKTTLNEPEKRKKKLKNSLAGYISAGKYRVRILRK